MNTAPKDAEAVPLPDLSYAGEIFGAISDWAFCAPGPAAGGLATKMYEVLNKAFRAYGDAREAACRADERARLAAQQPAFMRGRLSDEAIRAVNREVFGYVSKDHTKLWAYARAIEKATLAAIPPTHAQVDAAPHDSAETRDAALEALRRFPDRADYGRAEEFADATDTWWRSYCAALSAPTASPAIKGAPSADEQMIATLVHCARSVSPNALYDYDLQAVLEQAANRLRELAGRPARTAPEAMADGPMTKYPAVGARFWYRGDSTVTHQSWRGDFNDLSALQNGRCYPTEAAARAALVAKGGTGSAWPVNGVASTMLHDEGAIAQCGKCQRYTMDRNALHSSDDMQPVCDCGKQHYWSGSFPRPGPDAQWHGPAPTAALVAKKG